MASLQLAPLCASAGINRNTSTSRIHTMCLEYLHTTFGSRTRIRSRINAGLHQVASSYHSKHLCLRKNILFFHNAIFLLFNQTTVNRVNILTADDIDLIVDQHFANLAVSVDERTLDAGYYLRCIGHKTQTVTLVRMYKVPYSGSRSRGRRASDRAYARCPSLRR